MRSATLAAIALGTVTGLAASQGVGIIDDDLSASPNDSQVFSVTNFRNLGIYHPSATTFYIAQVSMNRLRLAPHWIETNGDWTVALTVYNVDAKYGNPNGLVTSTSDFVLMGTYKPSLDPTSPAQAFVPSTFAAKLNDTVTAGNFGLMLCRWKAGIAACLDHAGGVRFSMTNVPNATEFYGHVPVSGITATYVDPAPFVRKVNGNDELWMTWVDGLNLSAAQLDISSVVVDNTAKTITGTPSIVQSTKITLVVPTLTGRQPHSPSPIFDQNHYMHGLHCSERLSNDSDDYIAGDWSHQTPIHLNTESTNPAAWLNNGAAGNGRWFYANSGSQTGFYGALHYLDCGWAGGDQVKGGDTAVVVASVKDVNSGPNVAFLMMAIGTLPNSVFVPGFNGRLGIDPGTLLFTVSQPISDAWERCEFSLPIPASVTQRIDVPGQVLFVDPGVNTLFTLSNLIHLNLN